MKMTAHTYWPSMNAFMEYVAKGHGHLLSPATQLLYFHLCL